MAWLQATIQADSAVAERFADVLMEVGALSATIEDALAGTAEEQPIFGEPGEPVDQMWQHSLLERQSRGFDHVYAVTLRRGGSYSQAWAQEVFFEPNAPHR